MHRELFPQDDIKSNQASKRARKQPRRQVNRPSDGRTDGRNVKRVGWLRPQYPDRQTDRQVDRHRKEFLKLTFFQALAFR